MRFKVGDRVASINTGYTGKVTAIDHGYTGDGYVIRWDKSVPSYMNEVSTYRHMFESEAIPAKGAKEVVKARYAIVRPPPGEDLYFEVMVKTSRKWEDFYGEGDTQTVRAKTAAEARKKVQADLDKENKSHDSRVFSIVRVYEVSAPRKEKK